MIACNAAAECPFVMLCMAFIIISRAMNQPSSLSFFCSSSG